MTEVGTIYDSLKMQIDLSTPEEPNPENIEKRFVRDLGLIAMGEA
jgi:hypothetical protein